MKRAAIYARVSTGDQTCENQLHDLREYCRAREFTRVTEYVDQGISGPREKRPAVDKLMAEVKARRVDVVVVAAFDRLGRLRAALGGNARTLPSSGGGIHLAPRAD